MNTHTVILDCDTGEDDALALLVALANKVPLRHVVTSYGNTTLANATRNTLDLLQLAKNQNVTVISGASEPLQPHLLEPGHSAGEFVGKNGLCNVELVPSQRKPSETSLVEVIKDSRAISYIVTGPCTNLAIACQELGAAIQEHVEHVYIMGGALDVPGNSGPKDPITGNQVAEFNCYCDPFAFDVVLKSGLPITLVPWDLTSQLTIPFADIENFSSQTSVGQFAITLMQHFFQYYGLGHNRNFELNDPITVLAMMGRGSQKPEQVSVSLEPETFGQLIRDPQGQVVQVLHMNEQEQKNAVQAILWDLTISM